MTSYIITARTKEKREAYARDLCTKREISPFDITTLKLDEEVKAKKAVVKQSIGIDEIKQLQKLLYLKPVHGNEKAIIIYDAQLITTEAQNAMLKILEEPPEQTVILLTVDSTENLLPTILSRCTIIPLEDERREDSDADRESVQLFLTKLTRFTTGDALEFAEKVSKTKLTAVTWLETCIVMLHESYLIKAKGNHTSTKSQTRLIRNLQQAHTLIKTTNVNPRMTLEHLFLTLI